VGKTAPTADRLTTRDIPSGTRDQRRGPRELGWATGAQPMPAGLAVHISATGLRVPASATAGALHRPASSQPTNRPSKARTLAAEGRPTTAIRWSDPVKHPD